MSDWKPQPAPDAGVASGEERFRGSFGMVPRRAYDNRRNRSHRG